MNRVVSGLCVTVALFLCLAATPSPVCGQDEIQVVVSIDRDTIGLDEQAIIQVEVIGESQNLPNPKLPTLPMFEVYSQGRSSNISIVNGKVSASVTYRYMLLPLEAGTFPISGIAVVQNNKRYEGGTLEITVLKTGTGTAPELEDRAVDATGQRRDYFMEAIADNERPFVNEQVTLTLKIYFAVQTYGSPELTEPTTTGFWTEVLGNEAPYYQKISGRTYKVIERKYALFPTQTGKLTIGRAMIGATVAAQSRQRDPFSVFGMFGRGEEITMRSLPIQVDVRPLPTKSRPKDFTGTIGQFTISASVNRTEVEVNQPVTVVFSINGVGNIKSVAEPLLPDLEDFRVYRASTRENVSKQNDRMGGTKVFEEVFIPNKPGTLTIPAVSFNYFDPQRERYQTVRTRPITLRVLKPEGYVQGADVPYVSPDMTVGSRASDIRYIKSDIGKLTPAGRLIAFTPLYMVVNALPVMILAGTVLLRRRRKRLAADVGYARSRAASRLARKRLAKAKTMAAVDTAGEFYAELSLALMSYVADKLNLSPYGLTAQRLSELLEEQSADQQLVQDIVRFLEECDFARFAPAATSQEKIDHALRRAEDVIVRIEGVSFE
ncbi:MAG TPA: BatD family protein [Acidobacteriota bacterium]|nr:BatD family protein [Acidobacteriota bacterium]